MGGPVDMQKGRDSSGRKVRFLSHREEIDLAERVRAGDRDAWGVLYEHFHACLQGFIAGKTGDVDAAQDLVQECFIRAEKNLRGGRYNPEYRFYTFLRNIAGYLVLDYRCERFRGNSEGRRRAEASDGEGDGESPDASIPVPPDQADGTVRAELLRLAFLCCAKPHQLLAFGFVKLLEWKPREVVDDLSRWPLGRLGERFCEDYYACLVAFLDRRCFFGYYCSPLLEKLEKGFGEIYEEPEYARIRPSGEQRVKDLPFRAFFGAERSPEATLSDWCDKVAQRARKAVKEGILCSGKGIGIGSGGRSGRMGEDRHLEAKQIVAYAAGVMEDAQAREIETHLAGCRECSGRVKAHYFIRERFDELWTTWTAKSHAEDFLRGCALRCLGKADLAPGLKVRLEGFLSGAVRKFDGALRVLLDTAGRRAELIQEGLAPLCRPGGLFDFSPVPVPARIRGEGEPPPAAVETDGSPHVKVTADPFARKLTVRMEAVEPPWPLILLIPRDDGEAGAMVGEFRPVEGTDFILAEFEDLPSGEFILLLKTDFSHEETED